MSSPTSNPKEWLILQCQACGSPMKVRAQTAAGSRVSCPACHSPVAVQQAVPAGSPEFRADVLRSSPELTDAARRRMAEEDTRDEEFTPTLGNRPHAESGLVNRPAVPDDAFLQSLKPLETPDDDEQDQDSGTGSRTRKRRKKVSESRGGGLADWNTVLDRLPEAEILADPWLTPGMLPEDAIRSGATETVVSETSADGSTKRRVKKVRKRAIFSFAQLFFLRLTYGVRVAIVIISALIGIGGITFAVVTLRQKFTPTDYTDIINQRKPDPRILTWDDETQALEVVKQYLAAEGVEKKLPFVRLPNRVRPLMEVWYKQNPDTSMKADEIEERYKFRSTDIYFIKMRLYVQEPDPSTPGRTQRVSRAFVVEIGGTGEKREYKIDWETSVEWQPMSFEEFRRKQPRAPVAFRVQVEGGDYYNHDFLDENRWYSCRLNSIHGDGTKEFLFHGFIDRRSKAWEDLSPYVQQGSRASMILNLKYPQNAVSYDEVVIDGMVLPSWFYKDDTQPAAAKTGSR